MQNAAVPYSFIKFMNLSKLSMERQLLYIVRSLKLSTVNFAIFFVYQHRQPDRLDRFF